MVLSLVNCIYVSRALFSLSEHRPTQVSALRDINEELFVLIKFRCNEETMLHYTWFKLCTAVVHHHCNVFYVLTRLIKHSITYCDLDRKQRWPRIAYAFFTLHNTLWMRESASVWLVLWALRFHGYDRALVLSQNIALGFSRNHVESSVPCDNDTRWQRSLRSGQQATITRPAVQRRTLLIISIKPSLSKFSSSRCETVSSYEALLANVRFSRHWSFVLWL